MFDAAYQQCIANGTCDGDHTGPKFTATGATVISPGVGGTPGVYVVELDLGLPGDSAGDVVDIVTHLRGLITPLEAGVLAQAFWCPIPGVTGPFVIVATTLAATGAAVDSPFDFIIYKV